MAEINQESIGGKVSDFNEASLKMIRIHKIQEAANGFQFSKKYDCWFESLCALFKEVIGKMGSTEKKECKDIIEKLSQMISSRSHISESSVEFAKSNYCKKISKELFEFDCKLRELLDKHGLSSPDKQEDLF